MKWFRRIGPGFLVTAAFIGPGTVTTASLAGAGFGFTLLWAILFSTLATITLQEMSVRVGLVARSGLGEAVREAFAGPVGRALSVALIVGAIGFGNAAFQAGNLTGAAMGLELAFGLPRSWGAILVAVVAFALLALGRYRRMEQILIALVVVMSIAFLGSALYVRPSAAQLADGLVPRLPDQSLLLVMALIGTTVVPYNLFLHASAVREKWGPSESTEGALRAARWDSVLAIALGGVLTACILITAASFYEGGQSISSAGEMAAQLRPLLGAAAQELFTAGFVAAGVTSAITAPLAAAYAVSGVMGWHGGAAAWRFRAVWMVVLLVGAYFSSTGRNPVDLIVFAQAANGVILPLIAVFLLIVVNRWQTMGLHVNGFWGNVGGGLILRLTAALGIVGLLKAFGTLVP